MHTSFYHSVTALICCEAQYERGQTNGVREAFNNVTDRKIKIAVKLDGTHSDHGNAKSKHVIGKQKGKFVILVCKKSVDERAPRARRRS